MAAPVYDYVTLQPKDQVPERPFTDLWQNGPDSEAMVFMAQHVHRIAGERGPLPAGPYPRTLFPELLGGRYFRVVLARPALLTQPDDLQVVGFFGQRRPHADSVALDAVDLTLQAEFTDTSPVVCYATVQLDSGDCGNLVMLSHDAGPEQWRESRHHQYAVAELAPSYYWSVRLHNGYIKGGLSAQPQVVIRRTKYYDYRDSFWCAVRELSP